MKKTWIHEQQLSSWTIIEYEQGFKFVNTWKFIKKYIPEHFLNIEHFENSCTFFENSQTLFEFTKKPDLQTFYFKFVNIFVANVFDQYCKYCKIYEKHTNKKTMWKNEGKNALACWLVDGISLFAS